MRYLMQVAVTITRKNKAKSENGRVPIHNNPPRRPLIDISAATVAPTRKFKLGTPHQQEWIEKLSKSLMSIHVSNDIDNEGPPTTFEWTETAILHADVPIIDLLFTAGCSCTVECALINSTCECITWEGEDGGGSSYDEHGCVRFG